jgi:transposase
MPKLLFARPPRDIREARQVQKLAGSRHAPGDWILRARIIERGWGGERTTTIATALGCHPQTVRERLARFKAEGVEGLGDRAGGGRPPRLTEAERSMLVALAQDEPPGKLVRWADGTLAVEHPEQEAHWTLDALTAAAHARGIAVERSQVRRVLKKEGVRWRHTRSWATSTDPAFVPKGPRSSRSTPTPLRTRRSSASTNSVR